MTLSHGETYEVCANTEAGTLSSCDPNAGADDIEDGEDRSSDNAEGEDLHWREGALGNKDGGNRDKETLNKVLD